MSTLGRVRWFRGSLEVQTAQSQPRTGTPVEVPVPRKTSRRAGDVGLSINSESLRAPETTPRPIRSPIVRRLVANRCILRKTAPAANLPMTWWSRRADGRHSGDRIP
jgi:hypothetical protein